MSCREHRPGEGRMEQSERGSGISQYHGCLPHTHSRCTRGTWGCIPGVGLQCMRSDLSGPPQLAWLSCFSPPARLSTGAHQNPSSRDSESHPGINNPPAAVRDIATSLSSRSGFSSLEWIYRLAVSQERVTFPDLSFWDTSSSQSVPCTDLQRATVDTRRPNATTPCCTSSILGCSSTTPEGRRDEATCELAARRLGSPSRLSEKSPIAVTPSPGSTSGQCSPACQDPKHRAGPGQGQGRGTSQNPRSRGVQASTH